MLGLLSAAVLHSMTEFITSNNEAFAVSLSEASPDGPKNEKATSWPTTRISSELRNPYALGHAIYTLFTCPPHA